MTKAKAEKITGLDIEIYRNPRSGWVDAFACHADIPVAAGGAYGESDALAQLVQHNYERVSRLVFSAQKWRCCVCGKIRPLQAHHLKHRSKGRQDTMENLAGYCSQCHHAAHFGTGKI